MNAAEQSQPLPWKAVSEHPDFQSADWQTRQKMRNNYLDRVVRPLAKSEEDFARVRDQFFTATEPDVFGNDGYRQRTRVEDSAALNTGYGGGLAEQRALDARDAPEPQEAQGLALPGRDESSRASTTISGHATELPKGAAEAFTSLSGLALRGGAIAGANIDSKVRDLVTDELDRAEIYLQLRDSSDDPQDREAHERRLQGSVRTLRNIATSQMPKDAGNELMAFASRIESGDITEDLRNTARDEEWSRVTPPSERRQFQIGKGVEEWAREAFAPKEGYEESLAREFGGALGSLAGFATLSATFGPLASFGTAGSMGMVETYDRALEAGLSEEDALEFVAQGLPAGVAQALPAEFILGRLPPQIRNRIARTTADLGNSFLAEFAVENLGQIMQNNIAKSQYNPEQDLLDGTPWAGIMSGSASATLRALVMLLPGRKLPGTNNYSPDVEDGLADLRQAEGFSTTEADMGAAAELRQQIEGSTATQQQATQDIADWESQWRNHGQQYGLDPIDLTQDTGISATVSPNAADESQASTQPTSTARVEQAATQEDDAGARLIRSPAEQLSPAEQRARDRLLTGDGYAFLRERAEGNNDAVEAVDRMQALAIEGDADGAADAYKEARQLMKPVQQAPAEQVGAVESPAVESVTLAPDQPSPTPERITTRRVPVAAIQVDPSAYQFRSNVNQDGVDSRLEGVEKWDDLRAGNLILHERSDGALYAADGHHRINLARQLQQPDVNAIVLREADGVTVENARIEAATANIAAGSATAMDAAKVFRNADVKPAQAINRFDLPRTSPLVRDGIDIAKLGNDAFGAVLNGVVTEKDGAAIGRAFSEPEQQMAAIDVFQRVKPTNENQRALLANEVRQAGFAESQGEQGGLFGEGPAESLIGERVKVMDSLRQALVRDKRLFATLNENAQTAEKAGNRIAKERNDALQNASAQAVALLERATTTPVINQQINDAARRLKDGEALASVTRKLKEVLLNGPVTAANEQPRTSTLGRRPVNQAGQDAGRSEPVPAVNDARTARAGEQRLGDGADGQVLTGKVRLVGDGNSYGARIGSVSDGNRRQLMIDRQGGYFWGDYVEAAKRDVGLIIEGKHADFEVAVFPDSQAAREAAATTPRDRTEPQQGGEITAPGPDTQSEQSVTQDTADTPIELKLDGTPFQTERAVKLSKRFRDTPNAQPVEVEGGWGFAVPEQTAGAKVMEENRRLMEQSEVQHKRSEEIGNDQSKAATYDYENGDIELGEYTQRLDAAEQAEAQAPDLTLETQTEESLAQREQQVQQAEQVEADQRSQEAQRAQADRDADDFVLSGSNRTADIAEARGQSDLLGAQPQAAPSGDTPAFALQRGATARGLSKERAQATVDRFIDRYPGADDVTVTIHDNATTIPGFDPARDSRAHISGLYESQTDTVHLVRTAFDSESAVTETLQEEILVHKGLGFFKPEDRQQLYRDIQQAAEESAEVKALWDKTVRDYQAVAESTRLNNEQANRLYAEEMLGSLAQERPNWLKKGWRKLRQGIKKLLVKAGWVSPSIDMNDLRGRIELIADAFQRGRRAERRNFSADIQGRSNQTETPALSRDQQTTSAPTADDVSSALKGVSGLGRPMVLDIADQLDLDTGLMLTLRGINPQEVVAFTADTGELTVIAGNAETTEAAVTAAVMERIRQRGLASVLGDRLNTIGRKAHVATNLSKVGREVRRVVRAQYPFLDTAVSGDQNALALEVITRLNERGETPTYAMEALQQIRFLLSEIGVNDSTDLGRANRAYLDMIQRDYGGARPPTANGFELSLQDAPGYGTLMDMQAQVIDADGQVISDARVENGFSFNPVKSAYRLIASQSDRLRDSGSRPLIELGNRIDRYFDQEDSRLGKINRLLKPALDEMNRGGRRQRKNNARQFEQYWRDWDNGRRTEARAIYDANPAVAAMVDASVEMFHETGLENQSVKTPTRTGMWVFDGKRYRKIGKVQKGEFWPRQLRREVQEAIQDPSIDPVLWREMLDALVDSGFAKDRQEAATKLRDRESGYYSEQVSNDYFAGIEKARGEKLPEIFYDYSLDVVRHYGNQWARRISQVEQFGQKLQPADMDAFDEAHKLAADNRTKSYIGQVRNVIYGERNIGMAGTFASNANVLATGLHLTNYATAAQNFMTGSALNVQTFGSQRVLKAYVDLASDFSSLYREGLELGILGKDLMNLMRDAERSNIGVFGAESQTGRFGRVMQKVTGNRMTMSEAIREFTRLGMKYGGYNGTEQLIRANAFVAAKAQLGDALKRWNDSPMSLDARRYRRFMERNRIDVNALIRENGKGEETARYLRLMVNLPQGSYRADQAPLIIDTQVGRFFGKYQKFGTQTSRLFWQQRIKPFIELMQDSSATAAERARAAFDIFHYIGWGLVGGYTNRLIRNTLFGMMFVGPDWDEIIERFKDEDYGLGWAYVMDMAFNNAMSAGSIFGFFGSPMQMAKDFRDGQRVKNPLEPPSLAVFHGMAGLGTKFTQQGYRLSGQDVLDAILREYSLPRQIERTAATVANVVGVEPTGVRAFDFEIERLQAEMVRRDTNYVRGAARRWADATGIEARQSGSFSPGSTPSTPANNRIHRAIQLGNHRQAQALIQEELRGLNGDDYRKRMTSIKSTIRMRHPLRLAGNTMNQDQQREFMRWAREHLPESRYQTVKEVVDSYDQAVRMSGLGPSPW